MNADLDYLYAHHAVGLCPEERCVTARANLAAVVEERDRLREALTRIRDWCDDPREEIGRKHASQSRLLFAVIPNAADEALQGRVASREGSGTL
jgi:hypothetical protein